MSLMAIILWALHALSPTRGLIEGVRHLLTAVCNQLTAHASQDWLCANPDDPRGVATLERYLDDAEAMIHFIIYQKARAILGLRHTPWRRYRPSPPQRRRAQTFIALYARFEACALRFADIDRLAERRAEKLARLLEQSGFQLAEPAHAAFASGLTQRGEGCAAGATSPIIPVCPTLRAPQRAGQRAGPGARAPPWRSPLRQSDPTPTRTSSPARTIPHAPNAISFCFRPFSLSASAMRWRWHFASSPQKQSRAVTCARHSSSASSRASCASGRWKLAS